MFMDIGEEVRFRVSGIRFNHTPGPLQLKNGEALVSTNQICTHEVQGMAPKLYSNMRKFASFLS